MNTICGFMQNPYMTSNHTYTNQMGNTLQTNPFSTKGKASDAQRMLSKATAPGTTWGQSGDSLLSSSQSYGESLRTQRQLAKDTSLKLKTLKYQFKNISSKILRSKTSAAARQVVGQARREVLRLKREKQSGNYDKDEMDAAIEHAKAMERAAKKKVKHLEEEEMAKASGGPCADNLIEEKENVSEDTRCKEELADREAADVESSGQEVQAKADVEALMMEMFDELSDDMMEMLREMGLEELTDSLLSAKGDMDPADLKAMKIKHRNKEMKDIVKADAEYLKAVFDRLEKSKDIPVIPGNSGGISLGGTANISAMTGGGSTAPSPVINIVL